MLVLTNRGERALVGPTRSDPPLRIQLKDRVWDGLRPVLRRWVR